MKQPLVLAGPSGVGKNRLIRALMRDYSRFFKRVVTHTTRLPRPSEGSLVPISLLLCAFNDLTHSHYITR